MACILCKSLSNNAPRLKRNGRLLKDKQTQSFLHGAQFSLIIRLQIAFFIFKMHFNVSVAAETIIATKMCITNVLISAPIALLLSWSCF